MNAASQHKLNLREWINALGELSRLSNLQASTAEELCKWFALFSRLLPYALSYYPIRSEYFSDMLLVYAKGMLNLVFFTKVERLKDIEIIYIPLGVYDHVPRELAKHSKWSIEALSISQRENLASQVIWANIWYNLDSKFVHHWPETINIADREVIRMTLLDENGQDFVVFFDSQKLQMYWQDLPWKALSPNNSDDFRSVLAWPLERISSRTRKLWITVELNYDLSIFAWSIWSRPNGELTSLKQWSAFAFIKLPEDWIKTPVNHRLTVLSDGVSVNDLFAPDWKPSPYFTSNCLKLLAAIPNSQSSTEDPPQQLFREYAIFQIQDAPITRTETAKHDETWKIRRKWYLTTLKFPWFTADVHYGDYVMIDMYSGRIVAINDYMALVSTEGTMEKKVVTTTPRLWFSDFKTVRFDPSSHFVQLKDIGSLGTETPKILGTNLEHTGVSFHTIRNTQIIEAINKKIPHIHPVVREIAFKDEKNNWRRFILWQELTWEFVHGENFSLVKGYFLFDLKSRSLIAQWAELIGIISEGRPIYKTWKGLGWHSNLPKQHIIKAWQQLLAVIEQKTTPIALK